MSVLEEKEYSKNFDLSTWKELLPFVKPFKRQIIFMMVLMFIVAAIDAVSPFLTGWVIDNVIVPGETGKLPYFGIFYGILIIIQALVIWLFIDIAGKIDMGICYEIRKGAFHRIQELSFSYFDKTPTGWLMARLTSDTQKLGDVVAWGIVDLTWGITMMTTMAVLMAFTHLKLTLIILSVIPVLFVIAVYFQRKILKRFREVRKVNSKITASFSEGIRGAKTTKTLVREQANDMEFHKLTGSMRRSSVRAAVLSALFLPMVLTLGSIGTALAIGMGGNGVVAGTISFGVLVSFIFCSLQFFDPIMELSRVFADLQYAQASAERVISLIQTEPGIKDPEEIKESYGTFLHPKRENWPAIKGSITFENVSFAYDKGQAVLSNFNLEVSAGETIALVGETGSGKSTIVNLACRFYEPTEGKILIDGVDYRKRSLQWLHSHLGYVLQNPHLFSGTIMDNIRYGRLNATDEEVKEAARLVNAHEFITALSEGYQTDVGEEGAKLSTGEKQLVSFARAILANPMIFVLDEATSSVDTETEFLIQQAINKVLEGRTSFIIAHRLSTIRSADRILVVRNGKIEEGGTHHELLKNRGYYYRLYTNQFMEERESRLLSV